MLPQPRSGEDAAETTTDHGHIDGVGQQLPLGNRPHVRIGGVVAEFCFGVTVLGGTVGPNPSLTLESVAPAQGGKVVRSPRMRDRHCEGLTPIHRRPRDGRPTPTVTAPGQHCPGGAAMNYPLHQSLSRAYVCAWILVDSVRGVGARGAAAFGRPAAVRPALSRGTAAPARCRPRAVATPPMPGVPARRGRHR